MGLPSHAADDYRYFATPCWGKVDALRGGSGTGMWVVLGPMAIEPSNYGTSTNSTSIYNCMNPLNSVNFTETKSGGQKGLWVAGHLLNDNLGGSGTDPWNLTPLTQTANKKHAGYEGKIKRVLEIAKSRLDFYKTDAYIFGVEYEVLVHDYFGGPTEYPFHLAPSHITVQARLVKAAKADRALSVVSAVEVESLLHATPDHRNSFRDFNFKFKDGDIPIEIHNNDKDLGVESDEEI